jgi:hypothetical protein
MDSAADEEKTMATATVHDYDTGNALEGEATPELIAASTSEGSGTGAVGAYLSGGKWHYVPEGQDGNIRACGHDVRVVYVS